MAVVTFSDPDSAPAPKFLNSDAGPSPKNFSFENPTPVQTPAIIDATDIQQWFYLGSEVITEPECRSGLRKESTIFAEAGARPGVGFLTENRTRSRSENFSFTGVGQLILSLPHLQAAAIATWLNLNFLWVWTANC